MIKISTILSILFLLNLFAPVQAQNGQSFYAIDGSEWKTQFDRDNFEDELTIKQVWALDSLHSSQRLNTTFANGIGYLFGTYDKMIGDIRKMNDDTKQILDMCKVSPEYQKKLVALDLEEGEYVAINKETFYLIELMDIFNYLLTDRQILIEELIFLVEKSESPDVDDDVRDVFFFSYDNFNNKILPLSKRIEEQFKILGSIKD